MGALDGLSPGVSAASSSDSLKGLLRRRGPREKETDSERSSKVSRESSSENFREVHDYRGEPAGAGLASSASSHGCVECRQCRNFVCLRTDTSLNLYTVFTGSGAAELARRLRVCSFKSQWRQSSVRAFFLCSRSTGSSNICLRRQRMRQRSSPRVLN